MGGYAPSYMLGELLVLLVQAWTLCDNDAYGSSLCDGTFLGSTLSVSLNASKDIGLLAHCTLTRDSHALSQQSQCL